MTMLSAIRLDGVMQEATMVYDGPMNRDTFVAYIEHRLVPALRPGDIVIMDNLSSHKDAKVRELIEAADADLWYLPPYSPDLAPHWTLPSKSCGARSRRGCAASWPTRSTACWTRLPTPCERWAPANVPTISLRVGMEIIDAHCSKTHPSLGFRWMGSVSENLRRRGLGKYVSGDPAHGVCGASAG